MSDKIEKLQDLMDRYWSAAYEQGTYMGSEDDANRKAENAERELLEFVRAALVEERKRALDDGFLRGFMSSAEGYNGEYPFDLDEDCLSDPKWIEMRARVLHALMEKPE